MTLIYKPLIAIFLNGLTLYFLILVIPEIIYTGGLKFFVICGIVLGLINSFVKPIIKIVQLPFMLILGGIVLIAVNVGILWFLSYFLAVIEFRDVTLAFPNFETYVIGAIVFGVINWALNLMK